MLVNLSAAVTADGYMDDNTPERLTISTPEDMAEVYRLRTEHDAILVGAETLRRDNPALLLRDPEARRRRAERGLRPDLTKVTITASGKLDPSLRFFTEGDAEHYVFSTTRLPELDRVATVIRSDAPSARAIVTELEKRGIRQLFVEGGARILRLFLEEGMADTLRLAVNPAMTLGEGRGGAHFAFDAPGKPCTHSRFGSMEVSTWQLKPDTAADDLRFLRMAVDESRKCVPCATSYCVGAVVVTSDGSVSRAAPTKRRPRTMPSRRRSPKRWPQAPACAVRRSIPRWNLVRSGQASRRAAPNSFCATVSPTWLSRSTSPTASSHAAVR